MSNAIDAEFSKRLQNFLDRTGLYGFPWKTATILYTISWGWIFIVRDSYWSDDWEIFTDYAEFDFDLQGFAPWVKILVDAAQVVGPTVLRLITFLSFFIIGLFLIGILEKFEFLNEKQRQFSALTFLLLPFNTARVSLMVLIYTFSYFVFFLAWYVLIRFKTRKMFVLSLVLFFLSFGMHSLLMFYFLPVLHKFLLSNIGRTKLLLLFKRRHFFMLVLPFLYWVLRIFFWPEEVSYHEVSLTRLSSTISFVTVFASILFLVYVLQHRFVAIKQPLQFVFAGLICLFFGIFAYFMLGYFTAGWTFFTKYTVTFLGRSDWYSRHQTLQPLGAALLIVGVIGLLPKFLKKFTKQIQAFILAVCVAFNIGFGFEYVVDHSKQKEVISVLKEEGESELGSNYQFVDQSALLNARGRAYRERDWQGLIWLAYGVESMQASRVETMCESPKDARLVLIRGPETHWEALKNWVSDGDMGFKVTVDDTPGACKPEMVTSERVSRAIPILFYFTGAKG